VRGRIFRRLGCVTGAWLLAGVEVARAQSVAPPPKHVHVQVYAATDLTEVERVAIERSVAKGVAVAGKWKVTAGDPKAAKLSGAAAADKALAAAALLVKSSRAHLRQLELTKALAAALKAQRLYTRFLHHLVAKQGSAKALVDTQVVVATIEYLNGAESKASNALVRAFVLDPKLSYTPKRFPPQLQELVMQEKALFSNAGQGAAKNTVDGPGQLYVNGVKAAPAPMVIRKLPVGPNVATVVAPGAKPVVKIIDIKPNKTTEVAVSLGGGASRVRGPFAGSRSEVGESRPGKLLTAAAKRVNADALVLVLPRVADTGTRLTLYVYDMRSKTQAGRGEATGTADALGPKAAKSGEEVMRSARWRPAVALVSTTVPLWKRVYRYKYFWHAVGAAAGVMLITVVAVAASGMGPGKRVALFPSLVNF